MSNRNQSLLLVAGAAGAYWYFTQKKAIGLLNYYIHDIGVDFDGLAPLMKLNIAIQNPSNSSFLVRDFVGNISANGYNIGTVSSFTPLSVPAASQVYYPVIVRLNLIGVVTDIINLIQQRSGISQEIILNGYVNASGIVAPVYLKYKIAF